MGYSPTILGLPTYPDPAFGGELFLTPEGPFQLGLGVFDGAGAEGVRTGSLGPATLFGEPDAWFTIAELELAWGASPEPGEPAGRDVRPGRVGLGAWHHSGSFARFDGGAEDGTEGLYLVLDQQLWRATAGRGALDGYLQWGRADPDVSLFREHLGLGAVVHAFEHRAALGLGLSTVRLTDAAGAGLVDDRETAVELFVALELTPWLRIKPDLQFLDNPGGTGLADDAWVATLRATVSL
jgi:carbohydrate-selective porin OprB